jgi:hypothetical protein
MRLGTDVADAIISIGGRKIITELTVRLIGVNRSPDTRHEPEERRARVVCRIGDLVGREFHIPNMRM